MIQVNLLRLLSIQIKERKAVGGRVDAKDPKVGINNPSTKPRKRWLGKTSSNWMGLLRRMVVETTSR